MNNTFTLEIVTPEKAFPPQQVSFLDVPAVKGRLTILPRHEPCVCLLKAGTVTLRDGAGEEEIVTISSGAMEVTREHTTLLVDKVERE